MLAQLKLAAHTFNADSIVFGRFDIIMTASLQFRQQQKSFHSEPIRQRYLLFIFAVTCSWYRGSDNTVTTASMQCRDITEIDITDINEMIDCFKDWRTITNHTGNRHWIVTAELIFCRLWPQIAGGNCSLAVPYASLTLSEYDYHDKLRLNIIE